MTEAKEKKPNYSVGGINYREGFSYEAIQDLSGKPMFATSTGEYRATLKIEGETFEPYTKFPWKLASEPSGFRHADDDYIHSALVGFYQDHVYLKDPRAYDVAAGWTMATWRFENWRVYGPLYLLGTINTGKTTFLECFEETAFRSVRGGSMTSAPMFRLDNMYHPTFLLDEAQIINSEEKAEQQALVNERYRKGGRVWRMTGEGASMMPTPFDVAGFSVFASDHPPWPGLTSRALMFHMQKKPKGLKLKKTLTPEFLRAGLELRSWLLQYRFKHIRYDWSVDSELEQDPVDEKLEATLDDSRTREIGYGVLVSSPQESWPRILPWFQDLERDQMSQEQTGWTADYFRAYESATTENGRISAKEIRGQLMLLWDIKDSRDKRLPTTRSVMSALTTLGFSPTRMRDGSTGVFVDAELAERLRERYPPPSEES